MKMYVRTDLANMADKVLKRNIRKIENAHRMK